MMFFTKLKEGIVKSTKNLSIALSGMFAQFTGANDDFFEELEEVLIMSDLGTETTVAIVDELRDVTRKNGLKTAEEIKSALTEVLAKLVEFEKTGLQLNTKPAVILMIGVNGAGKTTTIGKLAAKYVSEGKKVLLCAGDTFRAAAGEQLSVWAKRADCDIVRRDEGTDPASVVFDSINAAKARGSDLIICDTAGRLHNKSNLMNELNKIDRIITRELPGCDKEVLLVLDATTGQNGLIQAEQFKNSADISGIVLTKYDGTAKGGVIYAIASRLKLPVKLIGVGEKPEDLIEFSGREFTKALFD